MDQEMMLKRMASFGVKNNFVVAHCLHEDGSLGVTSLCQKLSLSREEVLASLSALEEAEIVVKEGQGKNTSYALNAKALLEMADFLDALCSPAIGGCSCGCCSH
jgi:DNA-binding transcriptional ArsR family regulator